jgi:catechol 2,3-dioxygenase-like lactoylglutathione lyase family enzyme
MTTTRINGIGRVIIPVSDQDRALEFFVGTLGFEKRVDGFYGEGMRWVEVAPAGAATAIALIPPREGDPAGFEVSFITGDADADHAALESRGVDVDPEVVRMGEGIPPMFTFRDPDGNGFRMVEQD